MSFLTRFVPNFVSSLRINVLGAAFPRLGFHSLVQDTTTNAKAGGSFMICVRHNIRCHFPRPSERKRVKRHGYWQRMSTPAGRRILMRRILKGRFVLAH